MCEDIHIHGYDCRCLYIYIHGYTYAYLSYLMCIYIHIRNQTLDCGARTSVQMIS